MWDLDELKEDEEVLERIKLWIEKAKEEEKAVRQGKKIRDGYGYYSSLLKEAKQLIVRDKPERLRENPGRLIILRDWVFPMVQEGLRTEWEKARNDTKKKKQIIRSYVKDSSIFLTEEDLYSLYNATVAVLAWQYNVSESTIKRALRRKKSPKK